MRRGQDVPAERPVDSDPPAAETTEWLIADGLGGSASGTSLGVASRRTHALLTALSEGRPLTLLLGLDERLTDARGAWELSPATPPRARRPRRSRPPRRRLPARVPAAEPPPGAAAARKRRRRRRIPRARWCRAGSTARSRRRPKSFW